MTRHRLLHAVEIPLFINGYRVRRRKRVSWGITLSRFEISELEQRLTKCAQHRRSVERDAFGRPTDKCHECRLAIVMKQETPLSTRSWDRGQLFGPALRRTGRSLGWTSKRTTATSPSDDWHKEP